MYQSSLNQLSVRQLTWLVKLFIKKIWNIGQNLTLTKLHCNRGLPLSLTIGSRTKNKQDFGYSNGKLHYISPGILIYHNTVGRPSSSLIEHGTVFASVMLSAINFQKMDGHCSPDVKILLCYILEQLLLLQFTFLRMQLFQRNEVISNPTNKTTRKTFFYSRLLIWINRPLNSFRSMLTSIPEECPNLAAAKIPICLF